MIDHETCQQKHFEQARLTERFKREGVKHMLFDFDDTLIDTQHIFGTSIKAFADTLSELSGNGTDPSTVEDCFRKILEGIRGEFGIHPSIMQIAARIAGKHYEVDPDSPMMCQAIDAMMQLYKGQDTIVFDGAVETLSTIARAGVDPILVTHASEEFTWGKLRSAKLLGTFAGIFCIPTHMHKDEAAWNYVLDELHQTPQGVYVVGDSWTSDIRPALAIGIPHERVLRIRSRWVGANKGEIQGIRELDDIAGLIPALLRKGDNQKKKKGIVITD
ncbi:MAG: Phosphoglycolate phosphatase [Microgenomates bacterium OLB22]|nr:MAG: Phosphoglycolate phosphatase [Microgenomates bacterium OLB22]